MIGMFMSLHGLEEKVQENDKDKGILGRGGGGGNRKGRYREDSDIIKLLINVLCHSEKQGQTFKRY